MKKSNPEQIVLVHTRCSLLLPHRFCFRGSFKFVSFHSVLEGMFLPPPQRITEFPIKWKTIQIHLWIHRVSALAQAGEAGAHPTVCDPLLPGQRIVVCNSHHVSELAQTLEACDVRPIVPMVSTVMWVWWRAGRLCGSFGAADNLSSAGSSCRIGGSGRVFHRCGCAGGWAGWSSG